MVKKFLKRDNEMKIILASILVLMFFGLLSSGDSPYPVIKDFSYDMASRKVKTLYVDFNWNVKIQGKYDTQKVLLNIIFYNKDDEEIHIISELLQVKPKALQKFDGEHLVLLQVANELKRGGRIGVTLGVIKKKY